MIYLDNNTFQQEIFIPRSSVKNDASPEYATKNELENAIENEVIRADEKYAAKTDLLPYATTGWVESQGYLTEHQDISGKLDTSDFTAYTANTQTELDNKQDISGMTAYATTAFTESTYLKEHQSLSAYSTTEQVQTLINTAKQEVENEIPDVSDFVTSAQVNTQIESKGYLTAYTENDPVFMASPASGITSQDITNWNAKLDSSDLEPYYTSAQTNNAISDAVSGKADSSAVTAQISEVKQEIEAEIPTKISSLENDLNFASTGDVQTQINNATSGKQDTLVSGVNIKTINNESLLGSGNIVIQGGGGSDYSAGANIDITNNVISVTGITVPTKLSELTNDSGYINSEQAQTQIDNSISGKVDTDIFKAYTANTKTEIDNAVSLKADSNRVDEIEEVTASALVELHSTKQDTLVSGTNIKTINNESILGSGNIVIQGGSGSDYSAGTNIDITDNVISVTGITIPTSNTAFTNDAGYVNSGEVETQITSKGYITGYTENDPVFQASAASGISEQDITNWNNKLDSSALNPYYTSAQTDTAISNATSGKQDTLVSGTNIKTINNQSLLGSGNIEIQGGSGGGSNIIELTQAEYDALTAYTEDAIYVITDAQEINIDNYVTTGDLGSYYTSAQTDTAISNAISGKTDKVSVDSNEFECIFPTWNDQGCITGAYRTAYLASQNINGSYIMVFSDSDYHLPTIFAPTSAGSAGQPLLSNGSGAPVWGAYKFQFISQSQYDALATKDSTTIYFIVNEN